MIILNESIYKTHEIKLINRDILNLTGIKNISNFDDEEFLINSVMGGIVIKGKGLEVIHLDSDLKIKGKVNSILYSDKVKENKESLFSKLFK